MRNLFRILTVALSITLAALAPVQAGSLLFMGLGASGSGGGGGSTTDTPIMTPNGTTAPSAAAINYEPLMGGNNARWNATESVEETISSVAGTVKNLYAIPHASIVQGSYTVTLRVNGADSALTCVFTLAASCTDVTHSVTITKGDRLDWKVCPENTATCPAGSAPTAQVIAIGADFQTTDGTMPLFGSWLANNANADAYANFGGEVTATVAAASTDVSISNIMPVAGSIDQICIYAQVALTSTKTMTAALYHNGAVATNGLQTILHGTDNSGVWTCTDTGTAEAISALDTISVRITPANTTPTGNYNVSVRWTPTSAGMYPLFNTAGILANNATKFCPAGGLCATAQGSANEYQIANSTPAGFGNGSTLTASNLVAAVDSDPAGSATWAWTFRHDLTTNTTLTTSISHSTTNTIGGVAGVFSNVDNTHSYAAATGGVLLDMTIVPASTPTAITAWSKSAVAVHVP